MSIYVFFNIYFILEPSWLTLLCFKYIRKWFSYTYIYVSIIFQILFLYRSLQNVELSYLYYSVGPYFKYSNVKMSIPNSQPISPSHPSIPGNRKFILYIAYLGNLKKKKIIQMNIFTKQKHTQYVSFHTIGNLFPYNHDAVVLLSHFPYFLRTVI